MKENRRSENEGKERSTKEMKEKEVRSLRQRTEDQYGAGLTPCYRSTDNCNFLITDIRLKRDARSFAKI